MKKFFYRFHLYWTQLYLLKIILFWILPGQRIRLTGIYTVISLKISAVVSMAVFMWVMEIKWCRIKRYPAWCAGSVKKLKVPSFAGPAVVLLIPIIGKMQLDRRINVNLFPIRHGKCKGGQQLWYTWVSRFLRNDWSWTLPGDQYGRGTVQEAVDWVQYVNHANGSSYLTDMRLQNGRGTPWKVKYWGVGNESWDCGGSMTADYYVNEYKKYATMITSYSNTEKLFRIAVGPGSEGLRLDRNSDEEYSIPSLWRAFDTSLLSDRLVEKGAHTIFRRAVFQINGTGLADGQIY